MGRRGRKRQFGAEDEYWRLILGGIGTVEACKRVGIGRKTGYRWRAEGGGSAPGPPGRAAGVMCPARTPGGLDVAALVERRLAELRPDGVVFPSPRGLWARRSNYRRNIFDPAAAAAGWPRRARALAVELPQPAPRVRHLGPGPARGPHR